ncbi:peroxisomal (S)-2-hydroxy-acid oxidase [Planoprotostelium fungivorum]|uniref:Peroxisomal (S)-2-hydroxy-acid oxidase n=1 Tax=Planoprotostelium fungivorum TaxID=1890364 RepID=A0A2P6NVI9_9EUKA|nr:peroxisomal (S)-2-hydroxy-acid oxidase [Planoprotostelium fungivorum]
MASRGRDEDKKRLSEILSIQDLRSVSHSKMDQMAREYYDGGAGDGVTLKDNEAAYDRFIIRPRYLRDVSQCDPSTSLLDHPLTMPLGIAAAAMMKLAHPDGESAVARAAADFGSVVCLSTFSTTSLEDVHKAATTTTSMSGKRPCFLQLYIFQNRETTIKMLNRAMKAGYDAIALTIDSPYIGRRYNEVRNHFKLPSHLKLGNFEENSGVKVGGENLMEDIESKSRKQPDRYDPSLEWDKDIQWLRSVCGNMQIWLKGILTAEDAELALHHGVDGIIVSNHGGRQLDHVPSTLEALPEVVDVIRGRIPVHVDGGIRRGSDVFKAICLGADLCWVGRPILWGLAVAGQDGVRRALDILLEEFELTMKLAGCTHVKQLSRRMLAKRDAMGYQSRL